MQGSGYDITIGVEAPFPNNDLIARFKRSNQLKYGAQRDRQQYGRSRSVIMRLAGFAAYVTTVALLVLCTALACSHANVAGKARRLVTGTIIIPQSTPESETAYKVNSGSGLSSRIKSNISLVITTVGAGTSR